MIVARIIRLGFIANFLSHSVLIGFLTGVGIQVALGQVGGLFGVSEGSGTTLEKLANALRAIAGGEASLPTLAVSITVLVVIVGLGRVNKKIPGALLAVVGMIVASYAFDFASRGITTIGAVPSGLPPIGLPAIPADQLASDIVALLPVAFSMFILILAQSAATSRAYAMKYDDSFDENVDLVGLGLGNLAAGLSGTFVVNGSPTKTEMVDSAGGRSQVAQLTTGVIVVVVLLFLTVPLSYMPNAVLSAVVFLIGLKLVDFLGMGRIYRLRKDEFVVALVTAATVVVVGVEQGIILAIVLSVIVVLMHVYKPHDRVVSFAPDGKPKLSHLDGAGPGGARPGHLRLRGGALLREREPLQRGDHGDRRVRRPAAAVAGARRGRRGRPRLLRRRFGSPGRDRARGPWREPRAVLGRPGRAEAPRRLRPDREDRRRSDLRDLRGRA